MRYLRDSIVALDACIRHGSNLPTDKMYLNMAIEIPFKFNIQNNCNIECEDEWVNSFKDILNQ